MAAVQEQDIQKLLEEVEALRQKLESVGGQGRSVLLSMEPGLRDLRSKLALTGAGKIGTGVWGSIPEDQKTALHQQLSAIYKVLECAAEDGPSDPDSIMFDRHASNWVVWLIMVGAIIATVADLREIFLRWDKATITRVAQPPTPPGANKSPQTPAPGTPPGGSPANPAAPSQAPPPAPPAVGGDAEQFL